MTETDELAIISHYKNLDEKTKALFRDRVLAETGMSYSSFYTKLRGTSSFSKAEIYVINTIIEELKNGKEH